MTDDVRIVTAGTVLVALLERQGFTADDGLVIFDVALKLGRYAAGEARSALAASQADAVYRRTGLR